MTHALVIENLTKRYKDFTLDKISFSLPQGTILGIIGENGSGKSTLINTMLGIIPSDYSRLDILGRDLKTKPNENRIWLSFSTMPVTMNILLHSRSDVSCLMCIRTGI